MAGEVEQKIYQELWEAIYKKDLPKVCRLLKKDIDINVYRSNSDGASFLHAAARTGDVMIAIELIKKGIHLNKRLERGETALHIAATYGHAKLIGILIFNGANPKLTTNTGVTALHIAVAEGHIAAARALVNDGLGPYQEDRVGKTPLALAGDDQDMRAALIKTEPEYLLYEFEKDVEQVANRVCEGIRGLLN
ncbi:ankyrin repeat domain-containing protein [Thiotrichales bacterium 19S11-10]|nr:ankyrin repeat domain-containing protein [Thiotrichales bacterium 19S11-10]